MSLGVIMRLETLTTVPGVLILMSGLYDPLTLLFDAICFQEALTASRTTLPSTF